MDMEEIKELLKEVRISTDAVNTLKCQTCYANSSCLFTPRMRKECRGPWDSKAERLKDI